MDVECSRMGVMFNSLEVTLLVIVHSCRCYKILLLLLRLLLGSVMSFKNWLFIRLRRFWLLKVYHLT